MTCDETGNPPVSGDEVIITDGVTLQVNGNLTLDASIRVQDGGLLNFPNTSNKLDLNDGSDSGCGRYLIIENGGFVYGSSSSNQLRICDQKIAKGGGGCNTTNPPTEADSPEYCINKDDGLSGEIAIDEDGVNSSLLPVKLVYFYGNLRNGFIELNWQTSSETDFDYFEVLYSIDGISFNKIGEVAGKGNEESLSNYFFEHFKIVPGNNYYMLGIVNNDGTKEHSQIININNFSENNVEIYPTLNYIQGEINIFMPSFNYNFVKVTYTDTRGVEVYSTLRTNQDNTFLKVMPNIEFSPGMYFIEISTDRFTFRQKLEIIE